ncbi:serine protease 48-like [Drosophila subpulchrella]|uniref:serine protease 48-like n=1 Tax=Drosophila subpulchrella TaxID=1486046 RepID=UPI0018A1598F|nr:serine protease 48-like [Drosophila subpulchrella]
MSAALWFAFCTLLLFYQGSAQFLEQKCGKQQTVLIPHPWLVTIRNTTNLEFICAGTLINERYVLTAASCIKKGTQLIVRLGEQNLDTKYEDNIVAKAIVHRSPEQNDIALLRLKTNVAYNNHTQPICIIVNVEPNSKGNTYEISREDRKLPKEVECSWYRPILAFLYFLKPCPSKKEEVKLSPIEKGSPNHLFNGGIFLQKGILSFHNSTTNKDTYTDVGTYADWILPIALEVDIIMAPEPLLP